jgi:hypothetical protein
MVLLIAKDLNNEECKSRYQKKNGNYLARGGSTPPFMGLLNMQRADGFTQFFVTTSESFVCL